MKPTIAIIYGGVGAERDVSLMSAEYVLGLINREKYSTLEIVIEKNGGWYLNGNVITPVFPVKLGGKSGFLLDGNIIPTDAAFPLLHGDFGEDGKVQGALECAGIPYVGAGTLCGAVCSDKICTKAVAESLGIPVAKWICTFKDTCTETARAEAEKKLGYPMFIKPSGLGSSVGAHSVKSENDFVCAFTDAKSKGDGRVLIEEEITQKREVELAYFSALGAKILSEGGEIFTDGFYSYEEKYFSSRIKTAQAAALTNEEAELLCKYARALIQALDIRQLSRIDFFLSEGRILFNEINTMPGFTSSSLFAHMIEDKGISPSLLINSLIEDTVREGQN